MNTKKENNAEVFMRDEKIKIIPLGGLEEVGRNMTVVEYDRDIIIIDMGLQFPDEEMHGIDYIIPNTSYLKGREKDIRGIFFTHGHLDHIGAIPHILPNIGNPPMFAPDLTAALIRKKLDEFKDLPRPNLQIINPDSKINLGKIQVEFFHVTHSFPNSVGVVIKTPAGTVVITGDFKMDLNPVGDNPPDFARLAQIGSQGVTVLMADSTGAPKEGHAISESAILDDLTSIFEKSPGRLIVATFSSLISRIQHIVRLAEKFQRKVVVDGYSMRTNVEIAQKTGYLKTSTKIFVTPEESLKLPDKKVVILCTGAQGEGNAVLMRVANDEHKYFKIQPNDTVLFSSSVIPGNERTVHSLVDLLYQKGVAKVINYNMMDVHAGGHGQVEDLKLMLSLIRPQYLIPMHGNFYMLKLHSEIAQNLGMPPERTLVLSNGKVVEVNSQGIKVHKKTVPSGYIMVDGLGVGDIGNVVLRDRQMMAQDGMFTIVAIVDSKTGDVVGSPDIISRGFIYMKESKELLFEVRKKVKTIVKKTISKDHTANFSYVKDNIRDKIGQFLFSKTERRPMVLPVIIQI
jgi:ribonuclease J